MKTIVITGATSAIAQACAQIWSMDEKNQMVLIGRDGVRLEAVKSDLLVRTAAAAIQIKVVDFFNPNEVKEAVEQIANSTGIDIMLIAQGAMPTQTIMQHDLTTVAQTIALNSISPVLFAEPALLHFISRGAGTLAIIGSVAGDRGRKANYLYGATKAFLATYVSGLQQRFVGSDIKVILIKPGPTKSPMTMDLQSSGNRLAKPGIIASGIVEAIVKGTPVVYLPNIWRYIMFVVRIIPTSIFNKMNF
jgi:decaprenylphospho-beta-D-erythro-pentofuranosid-2-ulose 2-reductase